MAEFDEFSDEIKYICCLHSLNNRFYLVQWFSALHQGHEPEAVQQPVQAPLPCPLQELAPVQHPIPEPDPGPLHDPAPVQHPIPEPDPGPLHDPAPVQQPVPVPEFDPVHDPCAVQEPGPWPDATIVYNKAINRNYFNVLQSCCAKTII